MSNTKMISIIIPAYNVKSYIQRALNSAVNQTYPSVEVVIVDDGSTDGTWNVIQNYEKQYPNVVAIHQENMGVSVARNNAIRISKGEYFLFLDSDDWLEEDTVETLIKYQEENQDYLICCDRYFAYLNEHGKIYKERQRRKKEPETVEQKSALLTVGTGKYNLQSACYKIFKKEITEEYNLKFNCGIYHGEDGLFVFQYLQHCEGILFLTDPFWNILERPGSATTSPYNPKWITMMDSVEEMLSATHDDDIKSALIIYKAQRLMILANAYFHGINGMEHGYDEIRTYAMKLCENKEINRLDFLLNLKIRLIALLPKNLLAQLFKAKENLHQ